MYRVGIDLGSSYTKGVLVDENLTVVDSFFTKTGFDFNKAAQKVIDKFSAEHEINYPIFTCGYGRDEVKFPYVSNSEIIALAKAVFKKYQKKCSVIDIGGQDTKFITINTLGTVDTFKMNRKCAAGTGSFIEEIAFRLDIPPVEFNTYADQASSETRINSYCTVFAISEIVGLIKKGIPLSNIILGIYNSVIDRCLELSPIDDFLVITGGIPDYHPTIVKLFKKKFANCECPEKSQFMASYGCVLLNQ